MIPFIDLKAQYDVVRDDMEQAVLAVLRSGQFIMGPQVAELERELARRTGVDHVVSCASGTDALVMALMAEGIGPNDAVFCPPFTFMATAEAIALVGATPVFVDIEPDTFNLDPAKLEAALASMKPGLNPRAIIAVDLFGQVVDYEKICAFAGAHDLLVIEDAAQSFGATWRDRQACSLAPVACTSFFPAKPLGCYGDGGALFTDDADRADLYRSIRAHGQGADRYEHVRIGLTGRLDTVQAAILLEKLKIFDQELDRRNRIAERYSAAIAESGLALETPVVATESRSAWAQYCLLADGPAERQAVRDRLEAAGIPSTIYYPVPLHLQPAFAGLGYQAGDFPVSEQVAERIFSLPMHPYLDDGEVDRIVRAMVA